MSKLKQPKRAIGFIPTRPFAHQPKFRREGVTARTWDGIVSALGLRSSGWDCTYTGRIDKERVEWANLGGLMGVQAKCGMYDPRPRIVKGGEGDTNLGTGVQGV